MKYTTKLGEGTINGIAWCVEAHFEGVTLQHINARAWTDTDGDDGFYDANPVVVWQRVEDDT